MSSSTDLQHFGDPAQFEIAGRWLRDTKSRERLPLAEGWSCGEFRITACGQVLTEHRLQGRVQADLSWYLSPILGVGMTAFAEHLYNVDLINDAEREALLDRR